jgi:cell division protease FtsH
MQQFELAKDRVIMGTEWKSLVMTPEEKKMTAYHEAGHALVRTHEPASDPIHKATIIPRGGALGMVVSMPERDNYSYHRDKMLADLATVMGGRVAEEVIFGYEKVSSGASGDIKQATKLARAMVMRWGMSDKLGPLEYEEEQGETFLGYSQTQRHSMSNETALLIDSEIRRLVDEGHARATEVITKNIEQLHKVAGALLEYETLTGDEIKTLVEKGELNRDDASLRPAPVPTAGTSIPKTGRRKSVKSGAEVQDA